MSKKFVSKMPPSEARPLGTKAPKRAAKSGKRSKSAATDKPSDVAVISDVVMAQVPEAVVAEGDGAITPEVFVDTNENNSQNDEKTLDAPTTPIVESIQSAITPNVINTSGSLRTMQLSLDKISKSGTTAIYKGAAVAIRIGLGAFPNKTAPATLDLNGELAGPKAAKVAETKEERKARLAALPKPTAAERVAKLEAKLAKMRAKVAAGTPAEQPEPATV